MAVNACVVIMYGNASRSHRRELQTISARHASKSILPPTNEAPVFTMLCYFESELSKEEYM